MSSYDLAWVGATVLAIIGMGVGLALIGVLIRILDEIDHHISAWRMRRRRRRLQAQLGRDPDLLELLGIETRK